MKDIVIDIIQILIGILCIICFVLGIIKWSKKQDEKVWNNGYCECGGRFEYEQAVGHAYSTTYIYKCNSCGKHIEVMYNKGD